MASKTRHPLLADVKTFEEQGFKSVDTNNWYGFFASSKTSPEMIKTLNKKKHNNNNSHTSNKNNNDRNNQR